MESDDKFLICRRYKLKPELIKEIGQADRVMCTGCGRNGDFDEVFEAALQDISANVGDQWNDLISEAVSGLKNVRHTKSHVDKRAPPDFVFE